MACCSLVQVACDGQQDDLLDDFLQCCTQGKVNINALDKEGFAALHYAARFNRAEITMRLLETNCSKIVALLFSLLHVHINRCIAIHSFVMSCYLSSSFTRPQLGVI